MKVAIWGSRGILGSYLINTLPFNVVGVNRDIVDFTDSCAVKKYLTEQKFDVIINCATKGSGKVSEYSLHHIINNLTIFNYLNLYQDLYGRLINISSGAEYDKQKDILNISEKEIFNRNPIDSYGLSKNIIARCIHLQDNGYNLRLFGCFHKTEHPSRLFATIAKTKQCVVKHDCLFDFISINDFIKILQLYITLDETALKKDLNIVYDQKETLSTISKMFCNTHFPNVDVVVQDIKGLNYTGNSAKIKNFCKNNNLIFDGLKKSIENYFD